MFEKAEDLLDLPERPEMIEEETTDKKVVKEEKKFEPFRASLNPLSAISKTAPTKKRKDGKFAASYDSATLTTSIGLLDLKSLCRSFAYAIHQHIVFAQGKQTFAELSKEGESRFSYKFGKLLQIDLPAEKKAEEEAAKPAELDINKCKDILSESLSVMTGTHVRPELLGSYLTVEGEAEDDLDLSYTQTHIGEIFAGGGNL